MSLWMKEISDGRVLRIHVYGKLGKQDVDHLAAQIGRLVKRYGRIRVLLELHDFQGWSASAFWEELKLELRHYGEIERLAVVSEQNWLPDLSQFVQPLASTESRRYDMNEKQAARQWVLEGMA